jgi:hypothetical protein
VQQMQSTCRGKRLLLTNDHWCGSGLT